MGHRLLRIRMPTLIRLVNIRLIVFFYTPSLSLRTLSPWKNHPHFLQMAGPTRRFPHPLNSEHDQSIAGDVPSYEAPIYSQSSSEPKKIQGIMLMFPPAMNGHSEGKGYFEWKLTSTLQLGLTAAGKRFAASTPTAILSRKETLCHPIRRPF